MRYVIVGSSHYLYYILKAIKETDPKGIITLVERSSEVAKVLASEFGVASHSGNLLDPGTYEKIDIRKTDVFIAASDSDALNIRLIELMKKVFGVSKVIGVVNNPMNLNEYKKSGADHIINPFYTVETFIKASISSDRWIKSSTPELFGIDVYMNRFVKDVVFGITLSFLKSAVKDLGSDVMIIVIGRDGNIIKDPMYELIEGDTVMIVTPKGLGEEAIQRIVNAIERLKILKTGVDTGVTRL
ncbi:MAG: NAD-binding protein [Desulfurococcales archaeon]|nr:NAD-binding protein [Desulfurococcales archaeon]